MVAHATSEHDDHHHGHHDHRAAPCGSFFWSTRPGHHGLVAPPGRQHVWAALWHSILDRSRAELNCHEAGRTATAYREMRTSLTTGALGDAEDSAASRSLARCSVVYADPSPLLRSASIKVHTAGAIDP
jgi:hypothetical protein